MKIRDAFVSNSSSTSFVIAIKKPTNPVEEALLEAVEVLAKDCKCDTNINTVAGYKEMMIDRKKELEEDIRFAGKRIEKLTTLSKDKRLIAMLQLAKEFDDNLNYRRMKAESDFRWTPQNDIDHLNVSLKMALTRLTDVNEKISKLEGLNDDDQILSFDKDIHGIGNAGQTLKLFEEKANIIKIIENHTC
jgi:hypothetical protein